MGPGAGLMNKRSGSMFYSRVGFMGPYKAHRLMDNSTSVKGLCVVEASMWGTLVIRLDT